MRYVKEKDGTVRIEGLTKIDAELVHRLWPYMRDFDKFVRKMADKQKKNRDR